MAAARTVWTPERRARLRHMVTVEAMPYSYIAAELGCTRSAAIGQAHRMGLTQGPNRSGPQFRRVRAKKPQVHGRKPISKPKPPTPVTDKVRPNAPTPLGTSEAPDRSRCQFMHGDPRSPDRRFCAHPVVRGKSWCAFHYPIVYWKVGS